MYHLITSLLLLKTVVIKTTSLKLYFCGKCGPMVTTIPFPLLIHTVYLQGSDNILLGDRRRYVLNFKDIERGEIEKMCKREFMTSLHSCRPNIEIKGGISKRQVVRAFVFEKNSVDPLLTLGVKRHFKRYLEVTQLHSFTITHALKYQ